MAEISSHKTKESLWIIIKDMSDGDMPKVYNVTDYLDDHPGGVEVMVEVGGTDATNMFEDIGHSKDARMEMKKYEIGTLKLTEEEKAALAEAAAKKVAGGHKEGTGLSPLAVLVLLLAVLLGE
ncbi:unnamed protein product [Discosporangium mesarthrocarpum]